MEIIIKFLLLLYGDRVYKKFENKINNENRAAINGVQVL